MWLVLRGVQVSSLRRRTVWLLGNDVCSKADPRGDEKPPSTAESLDTLILTHQRRVITSTTDQPLITHNCHRIG